MTEREKEIFELIEQNPMISQAEIAQLLKIARTSVAVHISNLVKKGYIKGKGYITRATHPITVIGGANVDIQGKPEHNLIMNDSNPGGIRTSLGGVARNIAENIVKLGLSTRLITAIGQDSDGHMIKENALSNNLDMDDSLMVNDKRTSTYLYILDEKGDMVVAISDMEITKSLDESFLKTKVQKINKSEYTVIDANLLEESIHYLTEKLDHTKLILDTVSTTKAMRAKEVIHKFYAIKPNRIEAEALLGKKLITHEDIIEAGNEFLSMGIEKVLITLGIEGVYYADKDTSFFRKPVMITPINVTGAGDAFTAGLVYGLSHKLKPKDLVDFCMGASTVALLSPHTIATDMTKEAVLAVIEK